MVNEPHPLPDVRVAHIGVLAQNAAQVSASFLPAVSENVMREQE
jgi:hypothetical protein